MLRLYDFLESGNGYKVRLLLTQLGMPFERIELDITHGATRTPEFLARNAELRELLGPMFDPPDDETQVGEDDIEGGEHAAITQRTLGGDFQLRRELGRGGMGVVYEAHQSSLDRLVAVKILTDHPNLSVKAIARFRREAITAARLQHKSIVQIFETGEDDGCFSQQIEGNPLRTEIILVLDKSGSMHASHWDFDAVYMTRWKSLWLTVESILGDYATAADFGVELFPKVGSTSECDAAVPVSVPVAANSAPIVLSGIPGPDEEVAGKTPTGHGVEVARAHLLDIETDTPQVMILIADGNVSDSCGGNNSTSGVSTQLVDAFAAGIPTYVIGIDPDSATTQELNAFAIAGGAPLTGTEKFYNAQLGDELLAALQDVVIDTLSCVIPLSESPDDPSLTKVFVDGQEWPLVSDCETGDGWVFSSPYDEITLCGAACDALKEVHVATIEFECPARYENMELR